MSRLPLQLFVLLAASTALAPLQLNVYLPGLPLVQREFSAGVAEVQWTVSLAMAAFGAGLLLFGPLSDRFGRRPSLLMGLALFDVGSLAAAVAPSLPVLTLARVVQSAGAAQLFITGRAVIADVTPPEHMQRSVAQLTMVMLVGQMVAPLIGNVGMTLGGWRSIQYALAAAGLLVTAVITLRLQETHPADKRPPGGGGALAFAAGLVRPTLEVLGRRRFSWQLVQIGLLYSAFPAFVAIAPHLMIAAFHRPATEYAYYFALLPLGYFTGNAFVLRYGRRLGTPQLIQSGAITACVSALLSAALLALGVWHPLALFVPAGLLLNFGLGLALPTASARAVLRSMPNTASGWGLAGFSQQIVGAGAVQVMGFFPEDSVWPVLVLCVLAALTALWLERLFRHLPPPATTASPRSG